MTFEEFTPLAIRTESKNRPLSLEVIDLGLTDRILHGFMGLHTEMDEFNLAVKNKDRINMLEELGDALWYLAILKDELDFDTTIFKKSLEFNTEGLDLCKKTMFYGKELDINKIKTISSSLYNSVMVNINNLDGDARMVMETIIAKLKARYGDKFSNERADKRDLKAERSILEEGM